MQNTRAYIAECFGVFLLTLVVRFSLQSGAPLPTPVLAGLVVGLLVYAIGPISGAHLNPAVTVGLAVVKKITLIDAVMYLVAQLIGATFSGVVATLLLGSAFAVDVGDTVGIAIFEAIGAAVLLFGIASVVYGKTPASAAGLVIGTGLTLGIGVASAGSAGILNPAVALGIGSLSFSYLLGPLIGGVLATVGYRWLQAK